MHRLKIRFHSVLSGRIKTTLKMFCFGRVELFISLVETGLVILSYAPVCLHPCVSFNTEKNCRKISEHKIAVCEKTAGLRSGNSSDLDSASLKVLVPVNIFQF